MKIKIEQRGGPDETSYVHACDESGSDIPRTLFVTEGAFQRMGLFFISALLTAVPESEVEAVTVDDTLQATTREKMRKIAANPTEHIKPQHSSHPLLNLLAQALSSSDATEEGSS